MFFNNKWKMYEIINKEEKVNFQFLRFLMGWSKRKTKRNLDKLIKDNLIKTQKGCEKCGIDNIIYLPTPFGEFLDEDFKKKWTIKKW